LELDKVKFDFTIWSRKKMTEYCINCGQKLNPDDIFCSNCGSESEKPKASDSSDSSYASNNSQQGLMTQPKLYRSRNDRWIAGVCGGLGRHFNIDPILVRIGFILAVFGYGSGLILYIILAIFIEEEPVNSEFAPPMKTKPPY
jgi:phage shock protein PspC (stress-responsive transcriptional regulator)